MTQKGFAPLIILTVVALIGLFGYFSYKAYIYSKDGALVKNPTPAGSSNSTSLPQPSTATVAKSSKIYLLKIKLKSDTNVPEVEPTSQNYQNLSVYLSNIFSLPKDSINDLLFDSRTEKPFNTPQGPFNSSFYAVFAEPQVLKTSYENPFITVKTQVLGPEALAYLIKNDYCEKDADCSIRANMCSQGAYNYFQHYQDPPWGCGPGGYKSTFSWFSWGEYDDKLKCEVELKFDGAKCIKNVCTESGYQKVCINEGLPLP